MIGMSFLTTNTWEKHTKSSYISTHVEGKKNVKHAFRQIIRGRGYAIMSCISQH